MPHMTFSEYAASKGWAPATITEKIRSGVISPASIIKSEDGKNKIDSERADLDIEFFGEPEKMPVSGPAVSTENKPPTYDFAKIEKYRDAKLSTEEFKARKLELEIAEREERLLDADEVRKRIIKLVSQTKDSILNIPARIAPLLVSITDPVEMEAKLLQELNEALSNMSRLSV